MNTTRQQFSLAISCFCLLFLTGDAPAGPPAASAPRRAIDATNTMDKAEATPDARVERAGSAWRVRVSRSGGRPGITFRPPVGSWDVTGHEFVEARVKNVGKRPLSVHLALENPDAHRTERKSCCTGSATVPPGEHRSLRVSIAACPPRELETAFRGMRGTPGGFQTRPGYGIDPTNVVAIAVYVYRPGSDE